ncbi:MAG: sigma-70 family RNA polymerase sigma factor [Planctomycetes bacterium]|nr:sigma-70 family RNA polymerase sigma factor [Planctomycetota bacterium]
MIRRCLLRESDAISALSERLGCVRPTLASLNRRLSIPLHTTELRDLEQDVLVVILEKLGTFEGRARLESWIYRICFFELMNRRREVAKRSRRDRPLDEVVDPVTVGPDREAPSLDRIQRGLEQLGSPRAEIVYLKHFEHLTFQEIGETLGLSDNTVKTHYYRALVRLRAHFSAWAGSGGT